MQRFQGYQIWQSRVMKVMNATFIFRLNFKFLFTNWRSVQSFYWTPSLYQVLPVGPPPPIILPPVPIFKQCTVYKELNSPTRKFSASGGNKNCDKGWWSDPNDGNFGSPIDCHWFFQILTIGINGTNGFWVCAPIGPNGFWSDNHWTQWFFNGS